jgi:hypothetical protein
MSFRDAARACEQIRLHLREGLQGLRAVDRSRVTSATPRNLRGSANVDQATRRQYPNDARWDYVVGFRQGATNDSAIWVEVHPASSTASVGEVLRKLDWLKEWLKTDGKSLAQLPSIFVWLATDSVAFRSGSSSRRKIAEAGVAFFARAVRLEQLKK